MTVGRAHLPPTTVFRRLKTTRRCCDGRPIPVRRTWDFLDVIKFRVAVHTLSENAIRFRHANYDPDRAQKLISSSMSRHLSTRKMSSKSMHAFLSNLANRQTNIAGNIYAGNINAGNRIYILRCRRLITISYAIIFTQLDNMPHNIHSRTVIKHYLLYFQIP